MFARGVALHGPSEHYPRPDVECEPQCTRDRLVILSRCFGCAAAHPTMRACMRRSMATWPIPPVCLPRSTSMGHRCRIASRAGHTDEQTCMCQSSRSWMWRRKSWVQRALLVVARAAVLCKPRCSISSTKRLAMKRRSRGAITCRITRSLANQHLPAHVDSAHADTGGIVIMVGHDHQHYHQHECSTRTRPL